MTVKTKARSRKAPTKRLITQSTRPGRNSTGSPATKSDIILAMLRRPQGATAADLAEATSWQEHSVRGFLSGDLKKKRGLSVTAEKVDGVTRYCLAKGG